mmetsp:Transcript_7144/g.30431  ORF Transcript_7144/g.30431 Transcript_7144/m.30431 type:complete len:260 (+) Transcript_7144:2153-2932(+)
MFVRSMGMSLGVNSRKTSTVSRSRSASQNAAQNSHDSSATSSSPSLVRSIMYAITSRMLGASFSGARYSSETIPEHTSLRTPLSVSSASANRPRRYASIRCACDCGHEGTIRLMAPSPARRAATSPGAAPDAPLTSSSSFGSSRPAGDPSGIPATGTSRRPLSSSHTLYTASRPPSSRFGSAAAVSSATAEASAGYISGHPVGPAARAIMETHVPTVWRKNRLGWPKLRNKTFWMNTRFAPLAVCHPLFRLFFNNKPAV